jgi:hypothetical protein
MEAAFGLHQTKVQVQHFVLRCTGEPEVPGCKLQVLSWRVGAWAEGGVR